jgi:hypothetical protein
MGADLNLALQLVAFAMILVGLRFAILTHKGYAGGKDEEVKKAAKFEATHKDLMTLAVVVSGLGAVIWMVPNFMLGWFYGAKGLGFGTGGYNSYFEFSNVYYAHWYLIPIMVVVGTLTAVLGVYLVLRMRWSGFPEFLKVQNYRRVMIVTWTLWAINLLIGILVFYFFAVLGAG